MRNGAGHSGAGAGSTRWMCCATRSRSSGHSQAELADILGSRSRASEVLTRRRPLTLEMIQKDQCKLENPGRPPRAALSGRRNGSLSEVDDFFGRLGLGRARSERPAVRQRQAHGHRQDRTRGCPRRAGIAIEITFAMSPSRLASSVVASHPTPIILGSCSRGLVTKRPGGRTPASIRSRLPEASDEFAVPLCRIHHRLVHRVGEKRTPTRDSGDQAELHHHYVPV
jgi:hypothetical protein